MQEQKSQSAAESDRQTFIVRCWQALDGSYRYTVEAIGRPGTTRLGFVSRKELLNYLRLYLPEEEKEKGLPPGEASSDTPR